MQPANHLCTLCLQFTQSIQLSKRNQSQIAPATNSISNAGPAPIRARHVGDPAFFAPISKSNPAPTFSCVDLTHMHGAFCSSSPMRAVLLPKSCKNKIKNKKTKKEFMHV